MEADQHAVRPQSERVRYAVEAAREVHDAVRIDRGLDRHRVVAGVVALRARAAYVEPLRDRRQRPDRGLHPRGHHRDRCGVDARLVNARRAQSGQRQAVGERLDPVFRARPRHRLPAVAEPGEHRHAAGRRILETDLRVDIVFVADDDRGLGDVLEPYVPAPQPVAIAAVDLDPDRHVADAGVDQRQPGLVLADRCIALPVERRIEQRVLPRGRGLFGEDTVATAEEPQVLADVADLVDAGEPRADMEVDMAEIRVLRQVEAHRGRGGVAVADLEIDVAHRRIEGAGVRIADRRIERHAGLRRHRDLRRCSAAIGTRAGEEQHVRHAGLEAGGRRTEHDHRPRLADPEQPDARPDEDRPRYPVAAGGEEYDPLAALGTRRGIDRTLERRGIVGHAVALPTHRHRAGIGGCGQERRARRGRCRCRCPRDRQGGGKDRDTARIRWLGVDHETDSCIGRFE